MAPKVTPTPRPWCSGPMMTIFDAALDGDEQAIVTALDVCAQCPMLTACRTEALARPAKQRWGVMGGIYTPTPSEILTATDEAPLAVDLISPPPQEQPAADVVLQPALFLVDGDCELLDLQDELPLEWIAAMDSLAA